MLARFNWDENDTLSIFTNYTFKILPLAGKNKNESKRYYKLSKVTSNQATINDRSSQLLSTQTKADIITCGCLVLNSEGVTFYISEYRDVRAL